MSTQKQIEASRINGAKSQGAVTPEGKQISSGNATRHGLLSGSIVLKGESIERFEALYDSLLSEHQPATQSEIAVVNAMAAALWRRLRVWGFEKFSIDLDIANRDGPAWHTALLSYLSPDEKIATLLRYETAACAGAHWSYLGPHRAARFKCGIRFQPIESFFRNEPGNG